MIITCDTLDRFVLTIARLVEHGLTFAAHADSLTIKLTGGF